MTDRESRLEKVLDWFAREAFSEGAWWLIRKALAPALTVVLAGWAYLEGLPISFVILVGLSAMLLSLCIVLLVAIPKWLARKLAVESDQLTARIASEMPRLVAEHAPAPVTANPEALAAIRQKRESEDVAAALEDLAGIIERLRTKASREGREVIGFDEFERGVAVNFVVATATLGDAASSYVEESIGGIHAQPFRRRFDSDFEPVRADLWGDSRIWRLADQLGYAADDLRRLARRVRSLEVPVRTRPESPAAHGEASDRLWGSLWERS